MIAHSQPTPFAERWTILNFREKDFRGWMSNHEIHENIVPQKFGAIRYTQLMCCDIQYRIEHSHAHVCQLIYVPCTSVGQSGHIRSVFSKLKVIRSVSCHLYSKVIKMSGYRSFTDFFKPSRLHMDMLYGNGSSKLCIKCF